MVSTSVRETARMRDGGCCRVCGQFVGADMALHHVRYRSEGGPDSLDNLVTVGWTPWHDCHGVIHSGPKREWQAVLGYVITHGGVTARAVIRWLDAGTLDPAWLGLDSWEPGRLG